MHSMLASRISLGFAFRLLVGLVGISGGCVWFGNGDCYLIGALVAFLGLELSHISKLYKLSRV